MKRPTSMGIATPEFLSDARSSQPFIKDQCGQQDRLAFVESAADRETGTLQPRQSIDEHRRVYNDHLRYSERVNLPPDRRARRSSFNSSSVSRWGRMGISGNKVSKAFSRQIG